MKPNMYVIEGAGNVFIAIVDSTVEFDDARRSDAAALARSTFSRCADRVDSLLYLTPAKDATFGMRVFEKDGSESTMCGNGLRAAALLLSRISRSPMPTKFTVETPVGIHEVTVYSEDDIVITLGCCRMRGTMTIAGRTVYVGDVGEPHACVFDVIDEEEFVRLGRLFSSGTLPIGAVNFNAVRMENGTLSVRTFERGVRAETRSCGTGSVVSACIARTVFGNFPTVVSVRTRGGMLAVDTRRMTLRGAARILRSLRVSL